MILNLLEQAELSGRVDGDYLTGGVGELQAIGIVRVMVEESDFDKAKEIIDEWDSKQAIIEPTSKPKKSNSFSMTVAGFVCGIIVMAVYNSTPVTKDGIDYDGDGKLDETWTYKNYRINKAEVDRNLDGEVDLVVKYDRKGIIETADSDDDFDGTFETETYYDYGNPVWLKSDTTGDGFKDYRMNYVHGLANKASFIAPETESTVKVQYFGIQKLESAEIDSNSDGIIDTVVEYDSLEEITKTYDIKLSP